MDDVVIHEVSEGLEWRSPTHPPTHPPTTPRKYVFESAMLKVSRQRFHPKVQAACDFKMVFPWVGGHRKLTTKLRAHTANLASILGQSFLWSLFYILYCAREKLSLHRMWNCCGLALLCRPMAAGCCLQHRKFLCRKCCALRLNQGLFSRHQHPKYAGRVAELEPFESICHGMS